MENEDMKKMAMDALSMINGGANGELPDNEKQNLLDFARKSKERGLSMEWVLSCVRPNVREASAAYLRTIWDTL